MFNPLENEALEAWFQRLNAPLKRLPAEERTQLHQEVRQHLEALAAANEELGSSPPEALELALKQFGDPSKFSKKMAQEWHQAKTGFRSELMAVLLGCGLQAVGLGAVVILDCLWEGVFYNPGDKVYHHGQVTWAVVTLVTNALQYGTAAGASIVMGRKHPYQALKSAFYAMIPYVALAAWALWARITVPSNEFNNLVRLIANLSCFLAFMAVASIPTAYLASVTKRGWYKPSWEDFKLTWPKRRQISR